MELNINDYRIVRRDDRNLCLERRIESKKEGRKHEILFAPLAFFGKIDHLIKYLLNLEIAIPEGSNLIEQMERLPDELKAAEARIIAAIKENAGEI